MSSLESKILLVLINLVHRHLIHTLYSNPRQDSLLLSSNFVQKLTSHHMNVYIMLHLNIFVLMQSIWSRKTDGKLYGSRNSKAQSLNKKLLIQSILQSHCKKCQCQNKNYTLISYGNNYSKQTNKRDELFLNTSETESPVSFHMFSATFFTRKCFS